MTKVYVSYASQDRTLASEVHRWLVATGHEVFLDQDLRDGFVAGEEWEKRLYERLRWADAMVCVISSAAVKSVWCTAEISIALSRGSLLLPVLAEPGVYHPLLRSLQSIDFTVDPTAARAALEEALRRVDAAGGTGWLDDRSPFPGLRPFNAADHRMFFGRSREVEELVELLRSPAERSVGAVLLVAGPSGSGKSSLVQAGLLPVMARESGWWTLPPMLPGTDPVAALTQKLASAAQVLGLGWTVAQVHHQLDDTGLTGLVGELLLAARARRLLLVVDQFEELLIQVPPGRRTRFAQLLRPALGGPVQVIATLRSEFLDQLLADSDLAVLQTHIYALRPLRREALRTVIERPAQLAGIAVDDDLVARLVADTDSGEALPLLAFTLAQLAEGIGRGGQLSGARYDQLGGVQGALVRLADAALVEATMATGRRREEIIAGLLHLVTVDEQGRPTRWRVDRAQLPEPVNREVDVFVSRQLVITDTANGRVIIAVAHEALLSAWAPLAQAIAVNVSALRARRAVEQAATVWNDEGDPPIRLWDGRQLAAAVADTGAHIQSRELVTDRVDLTPTARAFLHASIRAQRRPWRRTRPLRDRHLRTPSPATPSEATDPLAEVTADAPTEAVTESLLSTIVAGIDQHSGVLSDLECAEDRLGVTDDVRTIARMLAALNTTPPLSIALLGDWGSGKSSFMRQVIERVDALAAASKHNPRRSAYATNVRQVRFNAWHYSDDHLWCGLVEHLFIELGDRGRDPNENQRDNLQSELDTEQAKLYKLTENLRAVDAVSVDAGWLGWLYHPFRLMRVLRAVGKSLRDEIRAPKRLLIGLGLILLGAGLVVGLDLFGQSVIGWVAGAITVMSGLLSPLVLAWRHVKTFTREARTKLQDEKKKSEDSIRSLETQLDLIDPARRLKNLLSAISSTDRYERYRGLTGRIRHDLDQLSRDLAAARQKWAIEDTDLPPPLQRIILYVDDLDRCISTRVVEVLQAVNLLLSMPLFVVVVAVDPRWLLLALEEHHGRLLNGSRHDRLAERRIRSLDYLDKIFHIPYAVRPMSHQGADYLRSLLPPADESEHHPRIEKTDPANSTPAQARFIVSDLDREGGQRETLTHDQDMAEDKGTVASQEASADQVAAGQVATDNFVVSQETAADQSTTDQTTTRQEVSADQVAAGQVATYDFFASQEAAADQVGAVHEVVTDRAVAGNEASTNVKLEAIDLTGRELRLQEAERNFLPLLASLLSTPRAVKKLTNLYRLMRIGVPKDQLADFVGGDNGGPYQAVAILLAAVVGAPAQAESLLLALSSATSDPGQDIVDVLTDLGEPPVANLLAERIRLIRKTLPVHGNVKTYQESVKMVARYSFETYHRFSGD